MASSLCKLESFIVHLVGGIVLRKSQITASWCTDQSAWTMSEQMAFFFQYQEVWHFVWWGRGVCMWKFHFFGFYQSVHFEDSAKNCLHFFCNFIMEGKKLWLGRLKEEFQKSPLVSNVAFGFILMGLERLVELEFECPCDPQYNRTFSSAFFVVPAIMAFLFMLIIQGCRCRKQCSKTGFFASFIPAVVWLILMLFDGQYFTCAMTHWEGRFVPLAQGVPQKWCKPIPDGNVDFQEQMLYSQKQFVISQVSTFFDCSLKLWMWTVTCECEVKLDLKELTHSLNGFRTLYVVLWLVCDSKESVHSDDY